MKKLSEIINEEIAPPAVTSSPETLDTTERALSYCSQISEMADEIYNTLDGLNSVDAALLTKLQTAYASVDDAYVATDETYDIDPLEYDDLDEYYTKEDLQEDLALQEVSSFTYMHAAALKKHGFRIAPSTAAKSTDKIIQLYGIPMRAGKYADLFVAVTDHKSEPWRVINGDKEARYSDASSLFKALQQHIDQSTALFESSISLSSAARLASTGLMDKSAAASFLIALRKMESGKSLSNPEIKLLVSSTVKLIDTITV
jgi:hypothetical protein